MNKVELLGRLVKDSELRTTTSGKNVATFTLAVNRNYRNKDGNIDADFIYCKAFDRTALNINKFFKKGSQIALTGSINTCTYETSDGIKKYLTEVVVESFDFIEKNPELKDKANDSSEDILPEIENPEEKDPFQSFGEQLEINDDDLPW